MALSPAARAVGEALGRWRTRIAETQTLTRLTLSLLQGGDRVDDERRRHLGRLLHVELRTLIQLPHLDFASLRTTTHARESGTDLRGADAIAAEAYLSARRATVTEMLGEIADAVVARDAERASSCIDQGRRALEELSRLLEMLETMMYPRVSSPEITIGVALERAAASRGHSIVMAGATNANLAQVRGLLRLLAEVIESVGGHAYVHAGRDAGWIEVNVSANATGAGELSLAVDRIELLRFAAYLLRAQARFVEGAWRLAFVSTDV